MTSRRAACPCRTPFSGDGDGNFTKDKAHYRERRREKGGVGGTGSGVDFRERSGTAAL